MLEKAIEKIKSEMKQNNNPYAQVVGGFLIQRLEENPEYAEKILQDGKTIMKSSDEMRKVAEKKKVGNYAVLTEQEGLEIVLKYFGIEANAPVAAPVVTPPVVQAPTAPRPKPNLDIDINDFM